MKTALLYITILSAFSLFAAPASDDGIGFPVIGKVQARHSRDIYANNWSIGCETMDRDLVEFETWKDHLGPLGTKQIRLQAGWTRCEKKFVSLKESYYAYQTVTSIFDDTLERIANYPYKVNSDASLSVFGYRMKHFDKQAVVIWLDGETPTNSNKKTPMSFEFPAGCFKDPVLVDLRDGRVYEIPKSTWKCNGTWYKFEDVPVYDSPILIVDRKLVRIEKLLGN